MASKQDNSNKSQPKNKIQALADFISDKLSHFSTLEFGEKIAYPCIGAGLLLFLIGLFMYVL